MFDATSTTSKARSQTLPFRLIRTVIGSFVSPLSALTAQRNEPLRQTAWVDGLKSFAMLVVFNYHFSFAWSAAPDLGWHHNEPTGKLIVHITRIFFNGLAMVYVFFLLGGYVISLAPRRAMASGAAGDASLMKQLSSSLFRRSLRLLLPVFAINAITFVLVQLGIYTWALQHYAKLPGFRPEPHFDVAPPFWEHVHIWTTEQAWMTNVFDFGNVRFCRHDPHQWFIPYQLRASFVCYVCLTMIAYLKPRLQTPFLFGLSMYAMYWSRFEVALFLWGACLASPKREKVQVTTHDTHNMAEASANGDEIPLLSPSRQDSSIDLESGPDASLLGMSHIAKTKSGGLLPQLLRISKKLWMLSSRYLSRPFWMAEFLISIWLLSTPRHYWRDSVGFTYLGTLVPSWFTPDNTFWPTIGTGLLCHCLSRAHQYSLISKLLRSRPAQLLGRYSFAFYLCHGPFLYTLSFPLLSFLWGRLGGQEGYRYLLALGITWLVSFVGILLVSIQFFNLVEEPCGRLSKHIERFMFRSEGS